MPFDLIAQNRPSMLNGARHYGVISHKQITPDKRGLGESAIR